MAQKAKGRVSKGKEGPSVVRRLRNRTERQLPDSDHMISEEATLGVKLPEVRVNGDKMEEMNHSLVSKDKFYLKVGVEK